MDIKKLPKWAQEHIADLQRQRDIVVRTLEQYHDDQTESPFFTDDMICDGVDGRRPSLRRRYIQAHCIEVSHCGVLLRILLRDKSIDLSWGHDDRVIGDVMFQPSSFQAAKLFKPNVGAEKGQHHD